MSNEIETDVPYKLSEAMEDVIMERKRQVMVEGWTMQHDDSHITGEMAEAAACYALVENYEHDCETYWPWNKDWWKPKDKRKNLVRAGALIIAEIEKLDRASNKQTKVN